MHQIHLLTWIVGLGMLYTFSVTIPFIVTFSVTIPFSVTFCDITRLSKVTYFVLQHRIDILYYLGHLSGSWMNRPDFIHCDQ